MNGEGGQAVLNARQDGVGKSPLCAHHSEDWLKQGPSVETHTRRASLVRSSISASPSKVSPELA